MNAPFSAPTARPSRSPGQRPGKLASPTTQAPKGRPKPRPNACGHRSPFQGLGNHRAPIPRALPWAQIGRPFGADRTLAALRDTLLPRLLSGELRVPLAEKWVEAHA